MRAPKRKGPFIGSVLNFKARAGHGEIAARVVAAFPSGELFEDSESVAS
jgi:hypothetical protein